jgi:hypothetical protein
VLDMTKKRKNYQNTFKLGPDEKPQMGKIREMMTDVVRGTCDEQDYARASNSNVIVALNTELQRRVKTACPSRHRCCVQTFFVENKDQDFNVGTKWLWNPEHDDHATIRFETRDLCVIAIAHFVYLE